MSPTSMRVTEPQPKPATTPVIKPARLRREIAIGPVRIAVVLSGAETNERVEALEFAAPAGAPAPGPHVHRTCAETFYVLEGTLRVSIDGQSQDLGPGSVAHVPAGCAHAFSYPGPGPTRFLVTLSPAMNIVGYFDELAALYARGWPPAPGAMEGLVGRYDLAPAVPRG